MRAIGGISLAVALISLALGLGLFRTGGGANDSPGLWITVALPYLIAGAAASVGLIASIVSVTRRSHGRHDQHDPRG